MPQDAESIRTTLVEMNHPQPPTPIQVENSTAVGISNKAIKQRMSKAMDIRFYRIWYRIKQEQFIVYWNPGKDNLGNYPTTHQFPAYHITARPVYFHEPKVSTVTLQGGVNYDKSARTACMLSPPFGHKNTYSARGIAVIPKQCTYYVYVITTIWSHNESFREVRQTVSLTVIQALFPTGVMSYGPFNHYTEVIGTRDKPLIYLYENPN